MQHHMQYMIVIMEECNCPHPHYPSCDMFVLRAALNHLHPTTVICVRGAKRKIRCISEEVFRATTAMAL